MEKINLKNFCDFCKNNAPLLVVTALALFFCYGIKLCQYSIGLDTEIVMMSNMMQNKHIFFTPIGRFGLDWLMWLFNIRGFSPPTAFFGAFCLIWLFTISYAYMKLFICHLIQTQDLLKNCQM